MAFKSRRFQPHFDNTKYGSVDEPSPIKAPAPQPPCRPSDGRRLRRDAVLCAEGCEPLLRHLLGHRLDLVARDELGVVPSLSLSAQELDQPPPGSYRLGSGLRALRALTVLAEGGDIGQQLDGADSRALVRAGERRLDRGLDDLGVKRLQLLAETGRHKAGVRLTPSHPRQLAVMTKAGHADMGTTKRYMHLAGVVFRDEADALERRLGLSTEPSTRPGAPQPTSDEVAALNGAETARSDAA